MRYDGDDMYTLSTGMKFYANNGIVGLGPAYQQGGEAWSLGAEMFEGYDGSLRQERFSADERREIAAFMIDQWRQWGERE